MGSPEPIHSARPDSNISPNPQNPPSPPAQNTIHTHQAGELILNNNASPGQPTVIHAVGRNNIGSENADVQDVAATSERQSAVVDNMKETLTWGEAFANFIDQWINEFLDLLDMNKTSSERIVNFTPEERQKHMDSLAIISKFTPPVFKIRAAESSGDGKTKGRVADGDSNVFTKLFAKRNISLEKLQRIDSENLGDLFTTFIEHSALLSSAKEDDYPLLVREFANMGEKIKENQMLRISLENYLAMSDGDRGVQHNTPRRPNITNSQINDDKFRQPFIKEVKDLIEKIDDDKKKMFYQTLDIAENTSNGPDQEQQGMTARLATLLAKALVKSEVSDLYKISTNSEKEEIQKMNFLLNVEGNVGRVIQFILENRKDFPTPTKYQTTPSINVGKL